MSFDKWQARLEGKKVKTFLQPDAEDEGYYRRPQMERQPNGRWKVLGYTAVAYFLDGNDLVGIIGDRDMTPDEVTDETLWSYVSSNPISHDWFVAVAENGMEWPDKEKWTSIVPPVRLSDNQPLPNEQSGDAPAEPEKPKLERHEELAAAIRAEIERAPKTVASVEDDAKAVGAKNKLAELRLAATKEGEALYKPIHAQYQALQKRWAAVVAPAIDEEKRLNTVVLTFRQAEKKKADEAAAAIAAEAKRKADAEFEANERAADRALARGEPAPDPVIAKEPSAPTPAPVPAAPTPTYGKRQVKAEEKKFAVINDWVAVFTHFQADTELRERLEKLATTAIRAGGTVPGATYREGFI
jgi:hypothetical protein